ncbi:hypothetical protein DFJ73DRAFT_813997 [Zopfochytrium polystomum]|nr:hypothetical protein DFJ73DRAFT_813997 [Zopfochytrium polystomum]
MSASSPAAAAAAAADTAANAQSQAPPPLTARISKMAMSLQLILWFLGHAITVFQSTYYIAYSRFLSGGGRGYWKALWAVLLSYGVILIKAHGIPQIKRAYLQRAWMDENTQYLLLALMWLSSRPVWVTLLPFAVFSFFHTINYTRAEILPVLVPQTSPLHSTITNKVAPAMRKFSQTYQPHGLRLVAYLEVWLIMPYLTLFVLTGTVSLFAPVLFAIFLRFRFFFSPLTREAFGELQRRLDGLFENPRMPPWAAAFYRRGVELVVRFGDVNVSKQAGPQQKAAAATPAAGTPSAR